MFSRLDIVMESASMRTRDGVRLDADVYRPAAEGTYPVLLMRQPDGRAIASTNGYAHPMWYAARGYIVAIQDVRGRGTSEGTFRLLQDDANDGADAIAWAAQLAGSSGAVGMYGCSYAGTNQLLAAAPASPQLKAIVPAMTGWDLYRDWAYENGAFVLRAGLEFALRVAAESARLAGDVEAYRDVCAAAAALPLGDLVPAQPDLLQRLRRYTHYFDWLDELAGAPYWNRISPSARVGELAANGPPMLFISGWYDGRLRGTLDAYHAIAAGGRVPARLVVGPWAHAPWVRRVGELDFGAQAIGEIDRLQLRWFDRWLKDDDNGVDREAPVRLFDMGTHVWIDLPSWPARTMHFALSSAGRAALDERDGALLADGPAREAIDVVVHDPWRPAPALGGPYGSPPGPVDRTTVEARPDVLTFTTAPLDEALVVAGDVVASLRVSTDAPDFDLACVLSRVTGDGRSYEIASGYRRVAASTGEPIAVPMRATCITLAAGESLRLSLAGASFPAYPVNPGTGDEPAAAHRADWRVITLAVHCGPAGSSIAIGVGA
jgi:putative CocE/NonD family hydrolase